MFEDRSPVAARRDFPRALFAHVSRNIASKGSGASFSRVYFRVGVDSGFGRPYRGVMALGPYRHGEDADSRHT